MCQQCDPSPLPYLAGATVLFTLPTTQQVELEPEQPGSKLVWVEDVNGPYTGVVFSHHRGWVKIRTRRDVFTLKPAAALEHVLAIVES